MSLPHERADALAAIGLHEEALRVYELLLERPGATSTDIAAATGWSVPQVRQWIKDIERKGLASRSPERPPRYRAAPPDLGIGALVAKKQGDLQAVLALAEQLGKKKPLTEDRGDDELTVELITGDDALQHAIEQIYRSANKEILELDRPPYLNTFQQHDTMREPVIRRGVSFRTIVDVRALDFPGRVQHIRSSIAAGEQTRVFQGVPIKAAIVDRRLALVPLHLKHATKSGLLMRPSLLLDMFCSHFEMLWEWATPFDTGVNPPANGNSAEAVDQEQLILLLAAGLRDKAVAHRLRLPARTLERRVAALQKQLHASTRFQAGWKAAMRSLHKPS
ncbi:MAG TPA: helix-turn-helix domain-containing protein [Pseudoxanthomonas sp.]|nr:helix-turn-helix domain-containing protein [Pseudoxanthomonas sp.]